MNYTDYLFFPVFAAFLLLYFLTPRKCRWFILLVASGLFYCTYGVELLPYAAGAIFVSWVGALWIQACYDRSERRISDELPPEEKRKTRNRVKRRCKCILWLCLLMIIGLLVYIKAQKYLAEIPALAMPTLYFAKVYQHIARWSLKIPLVKYFVVDTVAAETRWDVSFFVPLGISYYTMSLTGYLVDVYWKKEKAEKNLFRLALFALYFPKILEGPISKHRILAPQLAAGEGYDYTRFCHGWQRMLWGYFKKLCIADRLNLFVTTVYEDPSTIHGSVLLVGALFGVFQLYCDFSGCMDIGLGISEILGIRLEENFRQPFFSETAPEFWRRWHITLGVWFKDYIYMPLVASPRLVWISARIKKLFGKRAAKTVIRIVPIAVVWLLTGLWHGTGWNYVLWGVWWGSLMILGAVFEPQIQKLTAALHLNTNTRKFHLFRRIRTFLLFLVSHVITLSATLTVLGKVIHNLIYRFGAWELFDKSLYNYGLDRVNFWLALWLIVFLWLVERKQATGKVFKARIDSLAIGWRWCIYIGGLFFVLIFGIYGAGYDASSFVYQNF